jgi:hypothetical protein
MVAGVTVLAIGQLYLREWLLPKAPGLLGGVADACNQILIFSPLFLLLALRRHSLRTAWLPIDRVWLRILVGTVLALSSILVFTMARSESDHWLVVVRRVYQPQNLSHLVQVFLEDVAIAILFVRFRSAIGLRSTIALVAILFAVSHVPSLLADGAGITELAGLVLDAGLAVVVLSVVQLDMMQFYAVPDPGALAAG